MADRSIPLLLDALSRAASGIELPLLGKNALFPASATGKEAAQQAKDRGLVQVSRTESRGKTAESARITSAGLDFLLQQSSPRPVLEQFLQVLDQRQGRMDEMLTATQEARAELRDLRAAAEQVLTKLTELPPPLPAPLSAKQAQEAIVAHLDMWEAAAAIDDCPLPELYERVNRVAPLSVGQFHDALRQLVQDRKLELHPWTGPLYAIPQPQFATFTGHQIAYYASLRAAPIRQSA